MTFEKPDDGEQCNFAAAECDRPGDRDRRNA